MDPDALAAMLDRLRRGELTVAAVIERLRDLPFETLPEATVDHHRALRRGFPEVIFGTGKTPEQVVEIAGRIAGRMQTVLVTRAAPATAEALARAFPEAELDPVARTVVIPRGEIRRLPGRVLVVTAGTSDLSVAAEAANTAQVLGCEVDRMLDVGVAGLHRLLASSARLRAADVILVVAGMEGALPSVVGGLVDCPVIGVPTSVGYGAAFGGVAALLGMLTSCAGGLTVVNIDNGFGAGYAAALYLRSRGRSTGGDGAIIRVEAQHFEEARDSGDSRARATRSGRGTPES
jgi:NCAIR mutase (PurE)-related protein